MHRHGYKGTKFGRERDQRRALMKSLANSLVLYESIETTLPKAKEVARYTEKLITKAKKNDLHNRRQVISGLATLGAAHKLVDEISPRLSSRASGYFRVVPSSSRRGDGVQLAKVSFVDDLKQVTPKVKAPGATKKPAAKTPGTVATTDKKTNDRSGNKPKQPAGLQTATKVQPKQANVGTSKRTGIRGNR